MCYLESTSKELVVGDITEYSGIIVVIMLQFKDGISIDYQQSEKIKVGKGDFEQALLDVKPVSMGSCDLIMMSLLPSGIWCE